MFPVRASPTVPGSTEVDVTTASLRSWSGAKTNMRTMSGCIRRASLMHSLRMSVIRSYPRHRKCVEILPRSTPVAVVEERPRVHVQFSTQILDQFGGQSRCLLCRGFQTGYSRSVPADLLSQIILAHPLHRTGTADLLTYSAGVHDA